MSRWFDKAIDEIEKDYDEGLISYEELREATRELQRQLQSEAEEAAQAAYQDTMGYY